MNASLLDDCGIEYHETKCTATMFYLCIRFTWDCRFNTNNLKLQDTSENFGMMHTI